MGEGESGEEGGRGEPLPSRSSPYLLGLRKAPSAGTTVLIFSFVGYGALAHESGLSVAQSVFISLFVWALPGQVVLVSEIAAGAALWTAAIAVTLTAVRLLPLTVTLMPLVRNERTSKLQQIFLAHFCAITIWIESMQRLPGMARADRAPYYWGFCTFIVGSNLLATIVGHALAGYFNALLSAGLLFLTPVYFTLSMLRASDALADRLALLFGFALGPVVFVWLPGFELVLSGFAGGTVAYFIARHRRKAAA